MSLKSNAHCQFHFANEEYWGIVSISPDGTWDAGDGLDDITPRPLYYKLKEIFNNLPFALVRPGESIQAVIDAGGKLQMLLKADAPETYDPCAVEMRIDWGDTETSGSPPVLDLEF